MGVGVKRVSDEKFVADRDDLGRGLPRQLPLFCQFQILLGFLEREDRRERACKGASWVLSKADYDEILVSGF